MFKWSIFFVSMILICCIGVPFSNFSRSPFFAGLFFHFFMPLYNLSFLQTKVRFLTKIIKKKSSNDEYLCVEMKRKIEHLPIDRIGLKPEPKNQNKAFGYN